MATDESVPAHRSPNREGSLPEPPNLGKETTNEQEGNWIQDKVDMELSFSMELTDLEDNPNEEMVILIDYAGSNSDCMEMADEVRLPHAQKESTETRKKDETNMLKLPETLDRNATVNKIGKMMPSLPHPIESLEKRMSALCTLLNHILNIP